MKYFNELKAKQPTTNVNERNIYLLLSLIQETNAVFRNEDYTSIQITTSKNKDKNTLNVKTRELILRKGKTCKVHGERLFKLSKEFIELVRFHKKRSYLLHNSNNEQITTNNLSKILKRSKLGVSCSMLRNIYVSDKFDKGINGKERKELCKRMGHQPSTQAIIYSKLSKVIQGKNSDVHTLLQEAIDKVGEDVIKQVLKALT